MPEDEYAAKELEAVKGGDADASKVIAVDRRLKARTRSNAVNGWR